MRRAVIGSSRHCAPQRCEVRCGDVTWIIDRARLVDVVVRGSPGRSLPVAAPAAAESGRPLGRRQIDEALCLARHLDKLAHRVDVVACTGTWAFPIDVSDDVMRSAPS